MHGPVSPSGLRSLRPHVVLVLLTLGFTLNSLDRSILAVLLEPIGREFGASDTQLGLLSGLVFAVIYAVAGLPIAAWADSGRHRNVLVLGMLFWSAMTAACGVAPAFLWLLLARMGVAAGEAAGTPASHALIADQYAPERRATALSIYAIGAPAGFALAGFLGGHSYQWFGWRMTLVLAALPGLLLATVLALLIEDPARVIFVTARRDTQAWLETFRQMWSTGAYRHLWLGSAFHCIALFSTASFNTAFLMRSHAWSAAQAGMLVGVVGLAGAAGTFAGGWSADFLNRRSGDQRWNLRIAAMATLATAPFSIATYLITDSSWLFVLLPFTGLLGNAFLGPTYAATQAFSPPAARSRSVAVLMLAMTLVGMGLGPLLVGMASDALAGVAGSDALRYALLIAPVCNAWAAVHFLTAARAS